MTRTVVSTSNRAYTIAPDKVPLSKRNWGLLSMRAIDELTGRPPLVPVSLESDLPFSTPRTLPDGIVGLTGVPRHVFPSLASQAYRVQLTLRATGYLTRRHIVMMPMDLRTVAAPAPPLNADVITLNSVGALSVGEALLVGPPGPTISVVEILGVDLAANQVTIRPELRQLYSVGDPVVPVVPDDFRSTNIGDLTLHREPVVILGRTVEIVGNVTGAVPGVTVRITAIQRVTTALSGLPADPPNLVPLRPPLYFARDAAVGLLRRREMIEITGEDKTLLEDATPGGKKLQVSDRVNLAVGDIVLIDAFQPDLSEYLTVDSVIGASTPEQPARVILSYGIAHGHRRNTVVRRVLPQAPGSGNQFDEDAIVGDSCVFLNTMNDLAAATVVEVSGGAAPVEYHRLDRFTAASNSEGFFRFPPIRAGQPSQARSGRRHKGCDGGLVWSEL